VNPLFASGSPLLANRSQPETLSFLQNCRRVNVLVATALSPRLRRRLAAFAASADVRNSPYRVDPEPESEA